MKKQLILLTFVAFIANALYAQDVGRETYVIDELEDTTDVTTIKDIIKKQQKVFSNVSNTDHITDVWKRKSFFNISFVNETLKPDGQVPITKHDENNDGKSYINDGWAGEYKSDWGVSIQDGTNYRLHKKPIADMISICLDYSWLELSATHFKEVEEKGKKTVDENKYTSDPNLYTPFNAEKFNFNYGMTLGPSLTIAPFTHIDSAPGLHFLKFNAYFHVGYNVSLLLMKHEGKNDNAEIDGTVLDFGHGMLTSFGASMSWKSIGFGFERRTAKYKYKSLDSGDFGDNEYKFNSNSSRIYIQFRF